MTTIAAATTPVTTSTTAVTTMPVVTATTVATTTTAATTTLAATATSVSPSTSVNQDEPLSGYAHMISYDPARGYADFDFFEMLRGDRAVEWLVAHEGLSESDARMLVDDFADSEYIEENADTSATTIDLRDVELRLMYFPDGTMVTDATPRPSELIDLYDLYHVDPDLVLHSFFYSITTDEGVVVSVEQVYWP